MKIEAHLNCTMDGNNGVTFSSDDKQENVYVETRIGCTTHTIGIERKEFAKVAQLLLGNKSVVLSEHIFDAGQYLR